MHDIIIMQHMFYDLDPFIPLQTCLNDMDIHLSKTRKRYLNIQTLYICSIT